MPQLTFVPSLLKIFLKTTSYHGSRFRNSPLENLLFQPQPGGNGACQAIFLPGDNDIGGEGVDPVTPFKANRFNTNFPSKPLYHFQSTNLTLDIIPVSAILESLKKPQMGKGAFSYKDVVKKQKRPNDVRLVLSHFPIIFMNPYG